MPWGAGSGVPMALPFGFGAMKGSTRKAEQVCGARRKFLAMLLVLFSGLVVALGDLEARDRNPWAAPDPRAPVPTLQPPIDGRFAPHDYDPVHERRRRHGLPGEFPELDRRRHLEQPRSGLSFGQESRSLDWHDPLMGFTPGLTPGLTPWSTLHGIPGLTGSSSLYPYGAYPGSGILWPGTGLTAPGLGLPLYGSPLGHVPLYGLTY